MLLNPLQVTGDIIQSTPSQYVGKYKDNKTGAVSLEVKAAYRKPGEFTLKVHAGSGDLMDELLKAAAKLASKSS